MKAVPPALNALFDFEADTVCVAARPPPVL
jgi:hypothetical protein